MQATNFVQCNYRVLRSEPLGNEDDDCCAQEVTYTVLGDMPSSEQVAYDLRKEGCACSRDCCGNWHLNSAVADPKTRTVRVVWGMNI